MPQKIAPGCQAGKQRVAGMEIASLPLSTATEGAAMSISGVITTKDVLRHTATIVREFGPQAYLKCCLAILLRRRTTFLNCVCDLRN